MKVERDRSTNRFSPSTDRPRADSAITFAMRLDRILASRGYCSRSEARGFLKRFDVTLDGRQLTRESDHVDENAAIKIDNEPIDPPSLFILMNKPLGVTCSHKEAGELVYELLPERWQQRNPPVATIGRLDKETSGVLLLTDDGQLIHKLTSPKHHVDRVYLATLSRSIEESAIQLFASGKMKLEGDDKPLLPAQLEIIPEKQARITLHEGRYHQVRRMFASIGNEVIALHRERFGAYGVEGMEFGEWKLVTAPP